jgi:hypothetical protein
VHRARSWLVKWLVCGLLCAGGLLIRPTTVSAQQCYEVWLYDIYTDDLFSEGILCTDDTTVTAPVVYVDPNSNWWGPPDDPDWPQLPPPLPPPVNPPWEPDGACFDERDLIIKQYYDHGSPFIPGCSDFTTSVPTSSYYGFDLWRSRDMRFTNQILNVQAVGGVYCIVDNFSGHGAGPIPRLNSGYRTPDRDVSEGGDGHGFHTQGLAADLAANQVVYNNLRNIAKTGSCGDACVEPWANDPSHFHVDYRPYSSWAPSGCPGGW